MRTLKMIARSSGFISDVKESYQQALSQSVVMQFIFQRNAVLLPIV